MISKDDFQSALKLIEQSTNILIVTHTRPDGDACGSISALAQALRTLNKQTHCLLLSELPEWYQFLFTEPPILFEPGKSLPQLTESDLIILIDVNSDNQLPGISDLLKTSNKTILVFDHHVTGDGLGDIELIDPSAAATGLIVYDFFKFTNWPITTPIARALFVAIATDTGWFRFSNTDSRSFAAAADLLSYPIDPASLYRQLYQNFSLARFKLMTRMFASLELHFDGRFATQQLTAEDFEQTGAAYKDTENLIDEARRISTVEAAALFVELKDGRIRCSLRSTGRIDVRKIATKFGGGGHIVAAGVYLPAPLETAKQRILAAVKEQLDSHLAGQ